MARTNSTKRRSAIRSVTATIRVNNQDFRFQLQTRPLSLGNSVTVNYYWMDSRQFRRDAKKAEYSNFRSCVGHWAAAMCSIGRWNEVDQQVHYVTALCYPLINTSKGVQDIYSDAYLAPATRNSFDPIPREVELHVQDVIASRDHVRVQHELDCVLQRFRPPTRVLPLLQEAYRRWMVNGVVRMRASGNDGLELFLCEVDYWLSKYRKRSGKWARIFTNLFAYEAKVGFYLCYSNAWIGLIPWLRENEQLDPVSERFLRFWHCQNQPIGIPHGRTAGGIHYPTLGGSILTGRDQGDQPKWRSICWRSPYIGPTHREDVFSGQVLSLHPLSAFLMRDPEALAKVGRLITYPRFDDVMARGHTDLCHEYWDAIGAILTAAHRYRQARDKQAQDRKIRPIGRGKLDRVSCSTGEISEAEVLEEYAAKKKLKCKKCRVPLCYLRVHPVSKRGKTAQVDYRCKSCQSSRKISISESTLKAILFDLKK